MRNVNMISDALSECVDDIDRYLNDPLYRRMYGNIEPRLRQLRNEIDAVRQMFDAPPECFGNVTITPEHE